VGRNIAHGGLLAVLHSQESRACKKMQQREMEKLLKTFFLFSVADGFSLLS